MSLFCDFYRLGHEDGRACALEIIFDLLFLYGKDYFADSTALEVLTSALYDAEESIQNIAAEGFSKLFLHRVLGDEGILEGLFQLYLHPITSGPLKQCLSYFFQAFAFTSPANQLLICGLVGKVVGSWSSNHGGARSQLQLSSVASQLSYLADPQNLLQKPSPSPSTGLNKLYAQKHAQSAIDLCWAALSCLGDDSVKSLIGILVKVPLSPLPDEAPELKQLFFLIRQLHLYVSDKNSHNALTKVMSTVITLTGDDNTLEAELMGEMKRRLQQVLPASVVANTVAVHQPKKTKTVSASLAHTENIMDEITDLLE